METYPPRFFHRAKNDSPFISVGSKNLLTVNGSLMIKFCGVPLYRNDKASDGESSDENYPSYDAQEQSKTIFSPE